MFDDGWSKIGKHFVHFAEINPANPLQHKLTCGHMLPQIKAWTDYIVLLTSSIELIPWNMTKVARSVQADSSCGLLYDASRCSLIVYRLKLFYRNQKKEVNEMSANIIGKEILLGVVVVRGKKSSLLYEIYSRFHEALSSRYILFRPVNTTCLYGPLEHTNCSAFYYSIRRGFTIAPC